MVRFETSVKLRSDFQSIFTMFSINFLPQSLPRLTRSCFKLHCLFQFFTSPWKTYTPRENTSHISSIRFFEDMSSNYSSRKFLGTVRVQIEHLRATFYSLPERLTVMWLLDPFLAFERNYYRYDYSDAVIKSEHNLHVMLWSRLRVGFTFPITLI